MGRRSQRTHSAQQPPPTTHTDSTTTAASSSHAHATSSKRKSVSFDNNADEASQSQPGTSNTQPARRSRRTSTTTSTAGGPSTSSSNNNTSDSLPIPSAKALGKRRAVSPPPATSRAESSTKRRRTSTSSATDITQGEKDYNLRARPSRTTSSSSSAKKPTPSTRKTRSSTAATKGKTPMPRKGTRASKALKAKQRVLEEEEEFEGEEEGWEEEVGVGEREEGEGDVEMEDVGVGKKGKGVEEVVEKQEGGASPTKDASSAAKSSDVDALASSDRGDHSSDSHSDSDSDSNSNSDDEDDFDDDDDDEEIEEYETSLGLHGEERDGYGTEEDDLAHSAPRTRSFGAGEEQAQEREGLMDDDEGEDDAAMAEAEDALFGALAGATRGGAEAEEGGGAGGGGASALSAFRALHGMMSGVASRLKGLLASLRAKDGDSTAKLLALQELAELLSISTEDTLAGYFQIEAFAKELVAIVRGDSNGMGGAAGGAGGMTMEEALAFGLDPAEAGVGGDIKENDVQMMLLACRCLANLMEALPGSAHSIVYAGAVPVLCDKLKDIQYIDLAEQTLSTLEKISEEVPSSIVREGGLSALLTYIDFFSFHVQRTAVTAAANCCRNLTLDSFARVVEVMPIFKNILGYPDQRVVEQGSLAIVRIVDSYRHYPDKLEELLSNDLLVAVKALLNPDSTTVGASTYAQMLKMLTTATKASPAVAISLVELEIANTLYHLLTGVAPPEWKTDEGKQVLDRETTAEDDMLVMQNLVQRPKEQVAEVLNLVTELLPSLPKDGIFDSRAFVPGKERKSAAAKTVVKQEELSATVKREEETPDLNVVAGSSSTSKAAAASPDLAADVKMEGSDDTPASALAGSSSAAAGLLSAPRLGRTSSSSTTRSGRKSRDPAKEALKAKRLELVSLDAPASRKLVFKRYVALLLPTLVDVYAATVSPQVRTRAVLGLLKMVNFCEEDHLADVLRNVPFAAFISAILSSRENPAALITNALQLVELLLVKMHDAYQYTFRREGVMHEIARLADQPLVSQKSKRSSPSRTPLPDGSTSGAAAPSGLSRALQGAATKTVLSPSDAQAQDSMILRARHLRDTYGAADTEPAVRAQGVLDRIKALVEHLNGVAHAEASGAKAVAKVEKEAREALDEIAELFADEKNPLSSFEMIESGLVEGLLKFATETGDGPLLPTKRQELIAKTFMPQLEGRPSTPAFAVLVKRLQESLSRIEEFEVVVAAQSGSDNDSRRGGTTMLSRQLRLRLVAEDGSDIPRSCTNLVVSIHAIATFQAFNDYLRPKILAAQVASDRLSSGSAGGTLSSLLAAFAAAAGAAADDDADGAILSSSPPPRRTELGGPADAAAGSSSAAGKTADASQAKPKRDEPKRRRSSRLSGKGIDPTPDAAESSSAAAAQAEAKAALERAQALADEEDEEAYRHGNGDLYAGRLEGASAPKDDKPVHLEVNDEGENGGKLVAKTPDGTRVATPQPATKGSTSTASPGSAPSSKPRASYAAALKAEPTDFHLEFTMGGRDIDLDTTVYGAVHRYESERPSGLGGSMWYNVYEVKFRKVAGAARPDEDDANALGDRRRREGSIFTSMPSSIPNDSQQAKILQLLHVLRSVSSEYGDLESDGLIKQTGLSDSAFVNSKLTAKLNRQLEEPMIVASACLPDWAVDLAQSFPFLFPFDTRYTFLQSTSFGYARLMQKWVGQTRTDSNRRNDDLGMLGRLPRQKVRISRDRILESAYKVFELYGSSRASLEVEFFNEVGSGLGPTLEFYALVSKEFARKALGLWRAGDHSDTSDYVHAKMGLFPVPLADVSTDAGKKALKIFHVLGQFVAKALMDSRIIDVNFSRAFMRLVLEHDLPLNLASIKASLIAVDPDLGKSLAHLQEYVAEKEAVEADESRTEEQRVADLEAIQVRGATVSDLTLDFTLPGFDLELKDGGKDIAVDIHNVEEYIELVLDWTLRRGVQAQINEFKKGFSTVFPVRDLQTFTPAELVMITAAVDEDWSLETLTNATKADHGFTMDSRPVRDFLAHMAGLTVEERREFLSFMTGSPRLPIGGFAALDPPLTIVRKDGGDAVLPSVMSCVNYVKLPDYSSGEVLKERILLAVREGAGGFHLS
ncbi:Ubiquitin fusion degradation protein 4 [Rhodotorula toruloides]